MNIFKKLFVNSDKLIKNDKPDIDKLITSSDKNKSIIELDNYICSFCDYGNKVELLTESQKSFFYNQNVEREINNGGFIQFYLNSSGNFAHETVDSLKAIGANKTAEIVLKANNQFPDQIVPKNNILRQEVLNKIDKKANEIWEELDQKFINYEEDLNSLNIEFIKNNKIEF